MTESRKSPAGMPNTGVPFSLEGKEGMKTKKISEETLQILSRVTVKGSVVFLTCGQLDRKQYHAVNEVLENMGGKWNRKEKGHIFPEDPTDKLEQVFLYGEITPPKKNGYFPTPPDIAMKLIRLAEIETGMSVLEPSAGQGGIADFIPTDCRIDCVELLPDNVAILEKKGYQVQHCDFLSIETKPLYDRVVMNPPFENQQDIDHVTRAFGFLKSGGRLVSVMSAGVLFRENNKAVAFRELMKNNNGYVERLPEDSFRASGTNVNAVIVVIHAGSQEKRGKEGA